MVSVIEAGFIVAGIDAGDGISVAIAGVCGIDERVLAPVSCHHAKTCDDKGDDKDDEGCAPVVDTQSDGEDIETEFTGDHASQEVVVSASPLVNRKFPKSDKEELQEIVHKPEEAVALVAHGGAEIAIEVVLCVVHHDVVHVVGVGRFTEERTEHPWNVMVEQLVLAFKQRAVAGVMQHQDEGTEVQSEDVHEVDEREPPAEHSGPKEEHGKRKDDGALFERQIDKGKIARIADIIEEKPIERGVLFRFIVSRIVDDNAACHEGSPASLV